ncbi:hypothetical protein TNCV_5057981 [Trichonephila clavipes]|nr:hypothetical protein TNCV_5057981 [Trichonephila clavipes]
MSKRSLGNVTLETDDKNFVPWERKALDMTTGQSDFVKDGLTGFVANKKPIVRSKLTAIGKYPKITKVLV